MKGLNDGMIADVLALRNEGKSFLDKHRIDVEKLVDEERKLEFERIAERLNALAP